MNLSALYRVCRLCPRDCRADRSADHAQHAFCGESDRLRVSYVGPHFGEEPPISGRNGSGTVFLSGCSLKCAFCQNHQISHDGLGRAVSAVELAELIRGMIRAHPVHNISFVTPDHFLPHIRAAVRLLRSDGCDLPVVFNSSGYQSIRMLKLAESCVDIHLPDFKYADPELAATLSRCADYPAVALAAVSEMVRQKGFLRFRRRELPAARKGVLVRHLILPGQVQNSLSALDMLFVEFGPHLPVSLMSQYHPVRPTALPALDLRLTHAEFERVYDRARDLGFEQLYVQFPPSLRAEGPLPFLPDFRKPQPFRCGRSQGRQ